MENTKIAVHKLNLFYGDNHALKNVSMDIKENAITAFIGPSGCGKSTFLKTLNRMNDLVDGVSISGTIEIDGEDIYAKEIDTTMLRKKVGMVFQQPNPFPMSIYDNVAYGPRVHGIKDKKRLDKIVEDSLTSIGTSFQDIVADRSGFLPSSFHSSLHPLFQRVIFFVVFVPTWFLLFRND